MGANGIKDGHNECCTLVEWGWGRYTSTTGRRSLVVSSEEKRVVPFSQFTFARNGECTFAYSVQCISSLLVHYNSSLSNIFSCREDRYQCTIGKVNAAFSVAIEYPIQN